MDINNIQKTEIPKKSFDGNARRMIKELLGPTFVETGAFIGKINDNKLSPCGVITGYGSCDGRLVFVFAQDEENIGGAITEASASKIVRVIETAVQSGAPLLGIVASRGGDIGDGIGALAGYGKIMRAVREAQGIIPTFAMITGHCTGGMAAVTSLFDVIIGVDSGKMYVSSPSVVVEKLKNKGCGRLAGTEIGSVSAAAKVGSVSVHYDTDEKAISAFSTLLTFVPSVCGDSVIDSEETDDENRTTPEVAEILSKPDYDVSALVKIISDEGPIFELKKEFAPEMLTALAKLGGIAVGIVANNPAFGAVITADAAEKAAEFISLCDCFGLPVITLCDCDGFDASPKSELAPMSFSLASLAAAYIDAEIAKITVVTKKAYGTAYTVMGSQALGTNICFALENSEISAIAPETAVQLLNKDEINNSADPQNARERKLAEWKNANADIGVVASKGNIDDIIAPIELRQRLIAALYMLTFNN